MIRKYHNYKLQTTPRHREEEPFNHHETPGRKFKQSNQLSLSKTCTCKVTLKLHNNIKLLYILGFYKAIYQNDG